MWDIGSRVWPGPATRRRRISLDCYRLCGVFGSAPDNICKRPSAAQCSSCSASRPRPSLNGPFAITVDSSISYAALEARARAVAQRLRRSGIRRGDRVGLLCDNRMEWLEVFFAAAAIGAIVVPFSTWSTARELDFLAERLRRCDCCSPFPASANATSPRTLQHCAPAPPIGDWRKWSSSARPHARASRPIRAMARGRRLPSLAPGEGASAADPIVILYTSGSSNRPKAVPLDHFGTIENGFNIGERQGLVPGDRVLVSVPLFWSYGAVNALPAAITHGATLVMQGHFEAGGALDLIEREKCTAIYTLPAMTNALIAHPAFHRRRTASLRAGVTIGAPQDVIKAAEQLGAVEICNIYGATENYGNCCVTPHDWPLDKRATCQGIPLPGVQLRIRDPATGRDVEPGEIGEIEVRGYLTKGYLGDSAQFNASVIHIGRLLQDRRSRLPAAGRRAALRGAQLRDDQALGHQRLARRGRGGPATAPLRGACRRDRACRSGEGRAHRRLSDGEAGDRASTRRRSSSIAASISRATRFRIGCMCARALPLTSTGKLMRRELRAMAAKATAA